jgi:flagellin-like protein
MLQRKRMLKDDKALSPIIGEMLMIVVVFILAAILAVYAYTILDSATEVSSTTILIEGAEAGATSLTIVHIGGDKIPNAFTPSSSCFVNESVFDVLEVKINGAIYEGNATLNSGAISKSDFDVADELALKLDQPLSSGDRISVIYVPSGQIIREFDVW